MWTGVLPTHKATGVTLTPPTPVPKVNLGLMAFDHPVPNVTVMTIDADPWQQIDNQIQLDTPTVPIIA